MNGPYAPDEEAFDEMEDDAYVSDYSIGKDVIYAAFSWSLAEEAFETVKKLAMEHGVGFFDVSSNEGEIIFPDGKLI